MQVAFRVDASERIGLGHLTRCASLAAVLVALGAKVTFVVRDLGLDVGLRLETLGVGLIRLPRPVRCGITPASPSCQWSGVDWQEDACETVGCLQKFLPSLVVVDQYSFDADWHRFVREGLSAEVAAIDDLGNRPMAPDILIDHNLDAEGGGKYAGLTSGATRKLMGPRFALLGVAYRDAARYRFSIPVRSVGVFLGGVDREGVSLLALRGCREVAKFSGPIEIATTSANPHLAALRELAVSLPPTVVSVDLPDLSAFFRRHDIQIGAGGGAALERAAVGVPSLLLVTAENQFGVVKTMVERNAGFGIGPGEPLSAETIGTSFEAFANDADLRRRTCESAARLVDGRGAPRVAVFMLRDQVGVRAATAADTDRMFQWRNHPSTRALSRDPSPLVPDAHVEWVKRTLIDPHRHLLIGHVGTLDVGVVRFDELPSGAAEVSIYLDPDFHHLGLGASMLRAAESAFCASRRGQAHFIASVLDDNVASIKLFRLSGYVFSEGFWRKSRPAPFMGETQL